MVSAARSPVTGAGDWMIPFAIYYGMASKKENIETHIKKVASWVTPNKIMYVGQKPPVKVYDKLNGWFITLWVIHGKTHFHIWAPAERNIEHPELPTGYHMGELYEESIDNPEDMLAYRIDGDNWKNIPWEFDSNDFEEIDRAVKYVWLMTRRANVNEELELRKYIHEVLTEDTFEPTQLVRIARDDVHNLTTYKEIGGWMSADMFPKNGNVFPQNGNVRAIYQPAKNLDKSGQPLKGYGYRMGSLIRGGNNLFPFVNESGDVDRLVYRDNKGGKHWVPWDFDDIDNAVRFTYLQSILPASKIQPTTGSPTAESLNEDSNSKVTTKEIPGWYAVRHNPGNGSAIGYWMIYDDFRNMAAIYDNGNLHFGRFNMEDELDRNDLANNPKQTIRYTWLKFKAQTLGKSPKPLNEVTNKKASPIQSIEPLAEVIDQLLPEWQAVEFGDNDFYKYKIIDEHGRRVAVIGKYGLLFRSQFGRGNLDRDDSYELVDVNDPESIKQAMRYVYMMSKQPQ